MAKISEITKWVNSLERQNEYLKKALYELEENYANEDELDFGYANSLIDDYEYIKEEIEKSVSDMEYAINNLI